MRVYPIWDLTESKQAVKTQKWQLIYFLEIPFDETLDINRAKLLYKENSILIK
ncbi:MAG: MepB family protein [Flavobacterium sp.]|uniref:MepB family protein n=1 Tax=Flavobacterium sp. TaxID=239 RepID=UPI0026066349|nr:MepB family protein [Flavobacterium sp.]MDD5149384.1 MepB family protein [Flavobacterium sp.]